MPREIPDELVEVAARADDGLSASQHRQSREYFNAVCSECKRAIEWTSWKDEPMICGPCLHRIGEAAKWDAIGKARANAR